MQDTIRTGVEDTAARHISQTKRSTSTADDMTVVWSTRPVACDCVYAGRLRIDEPDEPLVWDTTGAGTWTLANAHQCNGCGSQVSWRARLHDGHLHGAALRSVASSIAADEDIRLAAAEARLRADLTRQVEAIADDELNELPDLENMTEPGVGITADRQLVVAWDYPPDGSDDLIDVDRPVATLRSHDA